MNVMDEPADRDCQQAAPLESPNVKEQYRPSYNLGISRSESSQTIGKAGRIYVHGGKRNAAQC